MTMTMPTTTTPTTRQPEDPPLDLSMEAVFKRAQQSVAPPPVVKKETVGRELDIEIVFHDAQGNERRGAVTSVITSKIDESRRVAQMFAGLTGGVPVAVAPEAEANYLYQYAWIYVAIPKRPAWFEEACANDDLMVALVYEEVMAHRAKFLRGTGDHAAGEGDEGSPRVRVSSAVSRPDPD